MSDKREQPNDLPYVDPNSGAATQPGGYAFAPVVEDGKFDAAVADEVTLEQEAAKAKRDEGDEADDEQDKKLDELKKVRRSRRPKADDDDDDKDE